MIVVSLQRKKCIGCNYCEEVARNFFKMSKKDGKSTLLNSEEKKGFYSIKIVNNKDEDILKKVAEICPTKIITVSIF